MSLLAQIVARLQQMFDLNANGAAIEAQLRQDPLFEHRFQSGLRIPGAWDGFELAVRAIVGQQVSVAAANRLFERIVTRYGTAFAVPQAPAELKYVFPQPSVLAGADLIEVGVIQSRAVAISRLAQAVVENPHFFDQLTTLDKAVEMLCQLRGIGPWTAHYIAMRALQAPDAFPPGDVALLRGMAALGEPLTKAELQERSSRWQPWRAYAAMQLWAVDSQSKPAVESLVRMVV